MSSERTLFGTDGIRGRANEPPMTPGLAMRLGMAVAAHFGRNGRVVVGKDTRLSGYMFETALSSGLCAMGADVMLVGPLPTPGIAYVTQSMRADAGVVISASHNPYYDNGIKLFAADGFKLPDEVELELERRLADPALEAGCARDTAIGRAVRIDDAAGRYLTQLKHSVPKRLTFDGIKLVVDCAHGAAYKIAPTIFAELGAEVVAIGVKPDGTNINDGCGALHPAALAAAVKAEGADLGLALDGDADRLIVCDAAGAIVDGDALLAICAKGLARRGALGRKAIAATVMSNMGLDRCLAAEGIEVVRTPVGDRYVVDRMRRLGLVLGGESSGHLVFLEHSTTGDGVLAGLQLLVEMIEAGRGVRELAACLEPLPQRSRAVAVRERIPLEQVPALARRIAQAEALLAEQGRVLVRYSGTELKLRLMVEGPDEALVERLLAELAELASRELAA